MVSKSYNLIHRSSTQIFGHTTNSHYNTTTSGANESLNSSGITAKASGFTSISHKQQDGRTPSSRAHHNLLRGTPLHILTMLIARAMPMSTFECTRKPFMKWNNDGNEMQGYIVEASRLKLWNTFSC